MPQPTHQDLHLDALLTFLSIAYMQDPSNYIADVIFPIVPVRKQSDKYASYTKGDWFRDEAQLRAPGTESEGSGYTVSMANTYYCENYAVHKDIPDEVRENADDVFNPDMEATLFVTDRLRLRREKKWAADFFTTTVWANDATITNKWSDYALSDPIGDVETGKDTIHASTSREAKDMVIGRQVWTKLRHHPDLIERIKYTQRGVLTTELVALLFDIDRILVGKAIENANKEGQTASMSYIFGKNMLLMHVAPRPALLTPSAGYTFHWNRFGGLSYIRRLRDDFKQKDRIEAHTFFDQKAVCTDLGYFASAVVA